MKVYKGTDKNMRCRGFQYNLGETAEIDGDIKLCKKGLHACEMPLDVLKYYPLNGGSRYFEAELEDVSEEIRYTDTKRVGKKLTLKKEINIPELADAQIEYIQAQRDFKNVINEKKDHPTEDRGAAFTTNYCGVASVTGYRGSASVTGDRGVASASGDCGIASTTGNGNMAVTAGKLSVASTVGRRSISVAAGDNSAASATGDFSTAFAVGESSVASAAGWVGTASVTGQQSIACAIGVEGTASATGKECVAISAGVQGAVMGEIGNAIVCVERKETGEIATILSGIVDEETLKPGVWYTVKNGKWREVEQ